MPLTPRQKAIFASMGKKRGRGKGKGYSSSKLAKAVQKLRIKKLSPTDIAIEESNKRRHIEHPNALPAGILTDKEVLRIARKRLDAKYKRLSKTFKKRPSNRWF